jgi:hypothetical protein
MGKTTRLSRAIRARYATPQAVCRRLGIDASLLESESDPLYEYLAVGKDGRRRARDSDPPIVHPSPRQNVDELEPMHERGMGPQNMGGDDEDDDPMQGFRRHLQENSEMSEDEIDKACGLARDFVRRKRANGKDRLPGRGGHFERPRFSRDKGRDATNEIQDHLDHMKSEGPEPGIATGANYGRGDYVKRGAMDAAVPSMKQREKTFSMFPGLARILLNP